MNQKHILNQKPGVWLRAKLSTECNERLEKLISKHKLAHGGKVNKDLFLSDYLEQKLMDEKI